MTFLHSFPKLVTILWLFLSPDVKAQAPGASNSPSRSLDTLLQDYAYRALVRPRTGTIYDAQVPANISGIKLATLRLRSGSLRTRGVNRYNEFHIPPGIVGEPYVKRLSLVYQNLGNWSSVYYSIPGFSFTAPVLGLLAYDASNVSATNLSELYIMASKDPISIRFAETAVPKGLTPKCVWFNLDGLAHFSNLIPPSSCSTVHQGHFSIVVESTAPAPSPSPSPVPANVAPPAPNQGPVPAHANKGKSNLWKIITGSVIGGFVVALLLGLLGFWLLRYGRKRKLTEMERQADLGEALQITSVGAFRAPAAMGTRTQPVLENDYAA